VRRVLPFAPFDFVDLLFNLQRLEVIEFRLMRLKFSVKFVFAGLLLPTSEMLSAGVPDVFDIRGRTLSLRSKRTTRPPLSPVAR
jgi:hypothetical protein